MVHHNELAVLKGSMVTFSMLHVPYLFKLIFQFIFRVCVFLMPDISLTAVLLYWKEKTHFELFNEIQSYSHIQSFGYLAYVQDNCVPKDKFRSQGWNVFFSSIRTVRKAGNFFI